MIRPGRPSSLRDLEDVRCLTALKISYLETEGNCKISHNNKSEWHSPGEKDYKLTASAFQKLPLPLLHLQVLQLQSLSVLAFSTNNFQLLRSWMQLVQFFIFSFFMLFLMSSSHLFFGLPNGLVNIGSYSHTFLTILSSDIWCKWPHQLNLCAFM